MTAAALTPSVEYFEDGVTLDFAAPFRFIAASHLEVKRIAADGIVTVLAYGSEWSASGGGTDAGGTVTLVASVAGSRLRIRRVTPRSQLADYTTGDTFPAESHEAALDKSMLVDQEQDVRIDDTALRALLVPEGETIAELPDEASRAGLFLAFDASGDPVASSGTGNDSALRSDLAGDDGGDLVAVKRGETAAVRRTMSAKALERFSLMDYLSTSQIAAGEAGVYAAGITAAFIAAVADAQKELWLGDGFTWIIDAEVACARDDLRLCGASKVLAKDATNFQYLFNANGRTGIDIFDVDFDANKAGRVAGQAVAFSALNLSGSIGAHLGGVKVRNTLGYGGSSTVAVNGSGTSQDFLAESCWAIDGGESALVKPSDGFFIRGNNARLIDCYGINMTDTAFVLEGCNDSAIIGASVRGGTSAAAISNDTGSRCRNNVIRGLHGAVDYVGSTGGVVHIAAFGAGDLTELSIRDVDLRVLSGAGGMGPLLQMRSVSTGRVKNVDLSDYKGDYGGTATVAPQLAMIQDCDDVRINNPLLIGDPDLGNACLRIEGNSSAAINGGLCKTGYYGLYAADTAVVLVNGTEFANNAGYGLYADDTATIIGNGERISGAGVAATGKAGGATLRGDMWAAWTPVFSTDLGDDAFSFTVTPTVNLSRLVRNGNMVSVAVNYAGTLNAIAPVQIRASLPAGAKPANDVFSPANILNNVTRETGEVRALAGGTDLLVFYRANAAAFTASVNWEARVSFAFEVAN